MKTVIRHLRRAALLLEGGGPSDSQLLETFISQRDDASFEALLRRHGPMVLGVCRRVLHNAHDAEDAFQATFLVLVRKGGSLQSRQLLANWLYGVAYRTAMKARTMNAKRRAKERHAGGMPHSNASHDRADEALLAQLDHELSRLPDKYRIPVVLCELQGKSRKDAARALGLPEGTLSWRLAQAKKMLAKRLSRKGAALSAGVVAAAMTEGTALAGLSPALRASTLKTVLSAGAVPVKVLALTEGVLKAMLLTKLKITVCFAALAIMAGVGASGLTYRATAEEPKREYARVSLRIADTSSPGDDLESLRLEIEALRKELRATRERVKALEEEVRGTRRFWKKDAEKAQAAPRDSKEKPGEKIESVTVTAPVTTISEWVVVKSKTTEDPLKEAQEALKKLKTNPDDKDAAQAVERALKWIKEREKPKTNSGGEKK
jgi:RNA polymerase sigma factor (sigma-70 family)